MKPLPALSFAGVLLAQFFVYSVDATCSIGNSAAVCSNPGLPPGHSHEAGQMYDAQSDTYTSICCPPGKEVGDPGCMNIPYKTKFCGPNQVQIYREIQTSGTQKYSTMCCQNGDKDIPFQRTKSTLCRPTKCMTDAEVGAETDLCKKGLEKRVYINETVLQLKEVTRDQCNDAGDGKNGAGTVALCCVPGTQDEYLTTLMGSEPREFPYFARVGRANCGGSIYNENWILTASHCVVNHEAGGTRQVWDAAVDGQDAWEDHVAQVRLNVQIRDATSMDTYNVTEIHVHPGSSYIKPLGDPEAELHVSINDLALLKLDRPIQFGENVKAIKIADSGFKPMKYGSHGFLTGFGTTDTLLQPGHRLKANMLLRQKDHVDFLTNYYDLLLFAGGILDGKRSPLFGQGDSGGPFLCRDENGKAVQCGVVGFLAGLGTEDCLNKLSAESCSVATFVDVGYYNDWIHSVTGEGQENAQMLDQPLYGSEVQENEFPAHVHVKSNDGIICGGTLIADDVVMTAAHCVAKDNGDLKNVEVTTGVLDLNAGGGKTIAGKATVLMDGFARVSRPQWGGGGRQKRMVSFVLESWQRGLLNDMDIMNVPYYKNDVALIKLSEGTGITPATLATRPPTTGDMAMEVAYPSKSLGTESNGKLPLSKREFKMLDRSECQRRMDRLRGLHYNVKVDSNVVCGVEHFSGGSMCDRELGGGVYCLGDDGQYSSVCGVQIHRLCEFNVPNEFIDVSSINAWINNGLNALKNV